MNIYFVLAAIYNSNYPEIHKFTFLELAQNTGKYADTEMFYALQELHSTEIEAMAIGDKPLQVQLSRDNNLSIGLISRISKGYFEKLKESTID